MCMCAKKRYEGVLECECFSVFYFIFTNTLVELFCRRGF